MNMRRWLHRNKLSMVMSIALLLGACAKSFDMSSERLTPLGPEWGVVIGSVLVKPPTLADKSTKSDANMTTYEFDIVQSQPGDPEGETPYAERYHLQAKVGEERMFISRLRTGRYLVKSFAKEGEVHYIGRLLVEVPQRVSRGKEYRFTVENAREETLRQISDRHAELVTQAVDAPMRSRESSAR